MIKRKLVRLFELRRGHLDYRIKRDYVKDGIATIPCRISDYSDVINTYSVKDYETLNTEFFEYVTTTAEVTPPDCPLVLNIIGDCLSQDEKNTIEEVIRDDFAYDLGMVEKEEKREGRRGDRRQRRDRDGERRERRDGDRRGGRREDFGPKKAVNQRIRPAKPAPAPAVEEAPAAEAEAVTE